MHRKGRNKKRSWPTWSTIRALPRKGWEETRKPQPGFWLCYQRVTPGNPPPRIQDSRITPWPELPSVCSIQFERGKRAKESSSGFGVIITALVGVRPLLRNLSVSCHRTYCPSFDHSRCIRPAVSGFVQQQQQQQQHQQMSLPCMGNLTLLLFLYRVGCGMCYRCFGESCSLYLQGAKQIPLYCRLYSAQTHGEKHFKHDRSTE